MDKEDVLNYLIGILFALITIGVPFYLIYKIFAGAYHLLELLINKM